MQIWRTTRSSPETSHESEASEASVFCFDNVSPEKSCFVDSLVCFISLCLLVFVSSRPQVFRFGKNFANGQNIKDAVVLGWGRQISENSGLTIAITVVTVIACQ